MFGHDLAAMIAAANLQVATLAAMPLPDVATLAPTGLPHGRHGLKLTQAAALDLLAQFTQRP
jgi:hypothetical protein